MLLTIDVPTLVLHGAHVLTYSAEFWRDLSVTWLTAWRQKPVDRLGQEWAAPVVAAGVPHREMLIEDDSVDGGLLRIADEGAGLIVPGAHGRHDLKDRLLGAVTCKLSQRADRPVVIVRADWDDDVQQRRASLRDVPGLGPGTLGGVVVPGRHPRISDWRSR